MPPRAIRQPWRQEERRILNILWTEYAHYFETFAEHAAFVVDVFGRIFGAQLKQDHADTGRPKYKASNLRDEWTTSDLPSKRHRDWSIIDPAGVSTVEEEEAKSAARQQIEDAINQTGGSNWLLEDDRGNLADSIVPIRLTIPTTAYKARARVLGRALPQLPFGPGGPLAAAQRAAFHARVDQQTDTTPGAGAPAADVQDGSQNGGQDDGQKGGQDDNVNDAQDAPGSPMKTRAARKAANKTSALPTAATGSSSSAQTTSSNSQPSITTSSAAQETEAKEEPRLPMVHTTLLILRPDLPYPSWDTSLSPSLPSIPDSTPIYAYGGLAARLSHPTANSLTDVMLCHLPVCYTCSNPDSSETHTLVPNVDETLSPFAGKPFIHIVRDCDTRRGEGHTFNPPATGSLPGTTLAEKTFEPKVRFVVEGMERKVKVRACQAMDCVVCSGEEEVRVRREGKEKFYEETRKRRGMGAAEGKGKGRA